MGNLLVLRKKTQLKNYIKYKIHQKRVKTEKLFLNPICTFLFIHFLKLFN